MDRYTFMKGSDDGTEVILSFKVAEDASWTGQVCGEREDCDSPLAMFVQFLNGCGFIVDMDRIVVGPVER